MLENPIKRTAAITQPSAICKHDSLQHCDNCDVNILSYGGSYAKISYGTYLLLIAEGMIQ